MKKAFSIRHSAFRRGMLSGAFLFLAFPSLAQAAVFHPEHYTLANGMQIVVVSGALSKAVSHMVWYKVGAADDPSGKTGIAHYLEHLMFKGTDKMPSGVFSAAIAAQGGGDNAFTGYDATAYYVSVAADRLPLIMQMEAERMRGLSLSVNEAASEKEVVLSERQQRTDNTPQGLFEEKLRAALFSGHPYGRPVIGWREDIEGLSPQDARAQYDRYYRPDNAVLVVSGDVKAQDVLRFAAATFGRLQGSDKPIFRADLVVLPETGEKRVERQDARIKQPYVTWRFAAPSAMMQKKNASYALTVLAEVLSGGEVGLLYRQFVVKTQKAGGLDVSYDPAARGPAVFSIMATPSAGQDVRTLEKEIDVYLRCLSKKGISFADVAAAKRRLQDGAIFARDRLMAPAEILGEALAIGQKIEDVEKWPEAIGAVSVAQVNDAFQKLLASPHQVRGILEPAEGKTP